MSRFTRWLEDAASLGAATQEKIRIREHAGDVIDIRIFQFTLEIGKAP